MIEIRTTYNNFSKDFPNYLSLFLKEMENKESMRLDDMEFFYCWDIIGEQSMDTLYMNYIDRLQYEFDNRLYVEIYIRCGNYIRGEVIEDIHSLPKSILDSFNEYIARVMLNEQCLLFNIDIIKSIPTVENESVELELDAILDKIHEHGMESLTKIEREYIMKKGS